MDLELKDRVAIVGGASKGLGRACAEVLAEEGAKVAMCSRTKADLESSAQEIRDKTGADVLAFDERRVDGAADIADGDES